MKYRKEIDCKKGTGCFFWFLKKDACPLFVLTPDYPNCY